MDRLFFNNQQQFDEYIKDHINRDGFWIKLSKKKEQKLTYDESVITALKYGWIDGGMKRIDDDYYEVYFTKRNPKSVWSQKNKKTIAKLIENNEIAKEGLEAIRIAKDNGYWDKANILPNDFSIESLISLLSINELALTNFLKMPKSIQKTYALSYFTLKTEESRQRRLIVIMQRLEKNLKPMDKM